MTQAGRPADRDRPAQPGPVRGRRDRATPRGGRRGRRLARLRRDRPGRPRARASSTASSACSPRRASRPRVFAEVEPNPGASTVERGAAALRAFGLDGTVVVPVGGGSSMDTAKALDLRADQRPAGLGARVRRPATSTPGRPVVAVPTTAGTGAETNSFGVITDEAAGRKGYIGHPSLLPGGDDPRSGPDRRAAAGRHGRDRHRRDDPFARIAAVGQPEPVRRGDGARRDPDGRGSGCAGPSPTARTSRRARRC